ncbi:MAG: hypothetical protein ACOYT8_03450 [Candidatus Dependentiae bacterium]
MHKHFIFILVSFTAVIYGSEHNEINSAIIDGSIMGIAGSLAAQLPNAAKNKSYSNQPIYLKDNRYTVIRNLMKSTYELRRGVIPFTASLTLGTVVQTPLKVTIEKYIYHKSSYELSALEEVSAVMGAGIASAIIVCPADYYTLKQQDLKTTLWRAIRSSKFSNVYRNVSVTGIREMFSAGFLFSDRAAQLVNLPTQNPALYSLGGSIPVALVTATLSTPVDKIKTKAQKNNISALKAFNQIYKQQGIKGLATLKDIFWRNIVFLSAIPAMRFTQEVLKKQRTNN